MSLRRLEQAAFPWFVHRVLRPLPFPVSQGVLVGLSLGRAVLDPRRVRRAYAWLARGGAGKRSPWPILAGLLVHRARAAAVSPFTGLVDPDRARRHLDVRGLGHLEAARRRGGVVLLGFHLGMLGLHRVLGLLGYEITAIAGGSRFRFPPPTARWRAAVARTPRAHKWTEGEPGSQADALLIGRCAGALPPGGRLVVHDVFLHDALDGPLAVALFSSTLLSLTEGRAYSASECGSWLCEAGLRLEGPAIPTIAHSGFLIASRPT